MRHTRRRTARLRVGRIVQFVRRNYFRVALPDGREVTAAMAEALFETYERARAADGPIVAAIEERPAPALARIVSVSYQT